jgi:protein involved in polysaccharide export with SLBB domain
LKRLRLILRLYIMIQLLNDFNTRGIRCLIILLFSLLFSVPVFAQLPTDLKTVNIDELSDEQIQTYIKESEKSAVPLDQQEKLILDRGLPPSELAKLKERVERLKNTSEVTETPKELLQQPAGNRVVEVSGEPPKNNVVTEPRATVQPQPTVEVLSDLSPNEIYGHHLFRDNNLQFFEKATDVRAPEDYIIGINDELTVSVFGFSYFNEVLKVDSRGAINPTGIGPIRIKGMEFSKAKALIRTKFNQFFDLSNNQLTITLSYSRVISINFVGEVQRPGSYKIPALNTAFNALIAVGGPNDLGSVRNIQIKRNGKLVRTLDVYEYLNNPNSKLNFYLEDNDYIYVSPSEKIVKISGEVKRSMKYELKPGENLDQLLQYAGGLTPLAYTKLISITRLSEDGNQQQLINVSLDSLKENNINFKLFDGDQISIGTKLSEISQFVEIAGAVFRPGNYQLIEGERISDLIAKANGLRKEAKLDKAYLIRTNSDQTKEYLLVNLSKVVGDAPDPSENRILEKGDVLRVFSTVDFIDKEFVIANGLFRTTGNFDLFEGMRISDLVFLAGGLKEGANLARAFLVRTKPNFTKEFIPVNLSEVMASEDDSSQNILLQNNDILTVGSLKDFVDEMSVSAIGLFRKPGSFAYVNGMTISDLLLLAGGLRMEADLLNIEVSRISFFSDDYVMGEDSRVTIKTMQVGQEAKLTDDELNFKLNPFDQVFVRMVPDFELPKNLTISGEVKYPGVYALTRKDEHLDELIKRAGGLNRFAFPEGATLYRPNLSGEYVVMKLPKALNNHKSMYNYILKEGDVINIPRVIDLIAIRGDVEYLSVIDQDQVNAPFVKGKRAKYYVNEFANGFTKTSKKKKTYVLEHSGKVNRTRNYLLFKVYPKVRKGSVIYVVSKPVNVKKEKKKSDPVDWNKAIADVTIKITGLLTLVILVRTVF